MRSWLVLLGFCVECLAMPISERLAEVGVPQYDATRAYEGFVVSYDPRTRTPWWVYEYLSGQTSEEPVPRAAHFYADASLPDIHRSTDGDYRGSDYDRGHMAAAANHRSSDHEMRETFLLSNVCPQCPQLNRQLWRKIEQWVRELADQWKGVHLFTGPLYLPNENHKVSYSVIGKHDVAVPTHFFKVGMICESSRVFALIVPNEPLGFDCSIHDFFVPLNEVERVSGLIFFSRVEH